MTDPDGAATADLDVGAPAVSRRSLLRGGVGLGLSIGAVAGGAAAAGVSYADTGATRHRAFAAKAEPRMPSSTRLLWRAQTDEPVLALTFDDGPDPTYTVPLLDTLAEHDVQATFFLVGERAVQHRDLLRRELAGSSRTSVEQRQRSCARRGAASPAPPCTSPQSKPWT